jgi:hypothetical protein
MCPPLLQLKYRALSDAFAELGKPEQVRRVFVGFQRHLYASGPAGGSLNLNPAVTAS